MVLEQCRRPDILMARNYLSFIPISRYRLWNAAAVTSCQTHKINLAYISNCYRIFAKILPFRPNISPPAGIRSGYPAFKGRYRTGLRGVNIGIVNFSHE